MTNIENQSITYGLDNPTDLLGKLIRDSEKLGAQPSPDDLFNFFVTANTLSEWTVKFYRLQNCDSSIFQKGTSKKEWIFPTEADSWVDVTMLPGKHNSSDSASFHINKVLTLCAHVANASKHFRWENNGSVTQIAMNPAPRNWYQFFTHRPNAGLCVDIDGYRYSIDQISHIVTNFYQGLIRYLET